MSEDMNLAQNTVSFRQVSVAQDFICARIRRTDVRPIFSRWAISDLLIPGNCTGRHPATGCLGRGEREPVWRFRLPERYSVLTAGTKGLPWKTRRRASRAFSPFLRAVEM